MLNTNKTATMEEVTIKTDLDLFQVELAIARHEAINSKKAVDTNLLNILTGLLIAHPELIDEVETHVVVPTCSHTHCSGAQEKVLDIIFDEDWQGLHNLVANDYIDLV